jgi:hypothetical protein
MKPWSTHYSRFHEKVNCLAEQERLDHLLPAALPHEHIRHGRFRDVVGLGQAPDLRLDLLLADP